MLLLEQIRQILGRRRRIVVLAVAIPLAGALGLVLSVPKSYRSKAVVVVERGPGVSDDDVDARLSALKSENLSRSRLKALIGRFNLYRANERRTPTELLIDQMQKDVRIDVDEEERGGRSVVVAVHVAYTATDPRVAADVANDLAAFYEREDLRMREQRAAYSRSKLQEQLVDARQRLDEQETRLKDYKVRHLSELPEQVGLHLAALEQLNSQIRGSRTEPSASARSQPVEHDERLDQLRVLETRFTDKHPDVKRLKHEIAALPYVPKALTGTQSVTTEAAASSAPTEAAGKARVDGIRRRVSELRQQAAVHEQGILNAPFRQQELDALLPDYVAARTRYQSLWEKYEIAQLWDPRYDGGRLRVLDPAVQRDQAVAPNVARMMAVSIALSLATVVGLVTLLERMDTSFHSLDDLRSFTRVPVLASVPRLVTSTERRRELRRTRRFTAMVLLIVALVFAASAYLGRGNQPVVSWMGQTRS